MEYGTDRFGEDIGRLTEKRDGFRDELEEVEENLEDLIAIGMS